MDHDKDHYIKILREGEVEPFREALDRYRPSMEVLENDLTHKKVRALLTEWFGEAKMRRCRWGGLVRSWVYRYRPYETYDPQNGIYDSKEDWNNPIEEYIYIDSQNCTLLWMMPSNTPISLADVYRRHCERCRWNLSNAQFAREYQRMLHQHTDEEQTRFREGLKRLEFHIEEGTGGPILIPPSFYEPVPSQQTFSREPLMTNSQNYTNTADPITWETNNQLLRLFKRCYGKIEERTIRGMKREGYASPRGKGWLTYINNTKNSPKLCLYYEPDPDRNTAPTSSVEILANTDELREEFFSGEDVVTPQDAIHRYYNCPDFKNAVDKIVQECKRDPEEEEFSEEDFNDDHIEAIPNKSQKPNKDEQDIKKIESYKRIIKALHKQLNRIDVVNRSEDINSKDKQDIIESLIEQVEEKGQ